MDIYIASYFCTTQEKINELLEIVLASNRISLDGKRKLLDIILKKQNPKIWELFPEFNKDMNDALRERNAFAHNSVLLSEEAKLKSDNFIGLIKYSVKTRVDWYDRVKVEGILKTIQKCSLFVEQIHTNRIILRPPA